VEAFASPRKPNAPSSVASAMKSPFQSSARKLVHNKQEEQAQQYQERPIENVNMALFQASMLHPSLDSTQVVEEEKENIAPNFSLKIDKSIVSNQKPSSFCITLFSTKLPSSTITTQQKDTRNQPSKCRRWLEVVVGEEYNLECAWPCMFVHRSSGSMHYYFDLKMVIVNGSFLLPIFLTINNASIALTGANNSPYSTGIKAMLYEDHVMQAAVSSALIFPFPATQHGQIMDDILLLDALGEEFPSSSRLPKASYQSLFRKWQQNVKQYDYRAYGKQHITEIYIIIYQLLLHIKSNITRRIRKRR
jgi:hypothetical protein